MIILLERLKKMLLKSGNLSEADEQTMIFRWAAYFPELRWMYAVPNGGHRNKIEAVNLKRQGTKAGVSDIALPLPKGKYHGLYLELKVGKNKPSELQKEFLKYAKEKGYATFVCYGHEEAISVITEYLKLKPGGEMNVY